MAYRRFPNTERAKHPLLRPEELGRIPSARLAEERRHWEEVRENADFLRLALAEIMLDYVLPAAEQPIQGEGVSLEVPGVRIDIFIGDNLSKFALSGLALSQFVRRSRLLDSPLVYGASPEGPVVDTDAYEQVALLHGTASVVGQLITPFRADRPGAWYRDGVSAVQVVQPARFAGQTLPKFRAEVAAEQPADAPPVQVDVSQFFTVVPHLTQGYASSHL